MRDVLRHRCLAWSLVPVLLPAVVLGCLVFADWTQARHWNDGKDGLPGQLGAAIEYGDHLHYVGHLLLGRALDACACAEDVAADQYERAGWHGRTARQLALVTSDRPRTPPEWVGDGAGIVASGARWGWQGTLWLVARLTRFAG
jgi:hypothetical protein